MNQKLNKTTKKSPDCVTFRDTSLTQVAKDQVSFGGNGTKV